MNESLGRVLKDGELEQAYFAAFPRTDPLWYGLWINSPLLKLQVELLHALLNDVFANWEPRGRDIDHFLLALQAAVRWQLPLHVSMFPPGHVDFGSHTVFPHCPRCKAGALVERWQESYPKELHTCRACGHPFIPDVHHKSEPDETDWGADDLAKQMGEDEYWQFVREFLLHQGRPRERVEEIITKHRNRRRI